MVTTNTMLTLKPEFSVPNPFAWLVPPYNPPPPELDIPVRLNPQNLKQYPYSNVGPPQEILRLVVCYHLHVVKD